MTSTLRSILLSRKLILGAIFLSIAVRIFLIISVGNHPDRAVQGDAGHYQFLAAQLLEQRRFWGPSVFLGSSDPDAPFRGIVFTPPGSLPGVGPMPEAFRTPAYPLFLGAIATTVGKSVAAVAIVQTLLVALIGWMIFRICTLYASVSIGWLAVALFSWNLEFLELPNLLLTETLFVTLLVCAIWLMLRFVKDGTWTLLALAGVAIGIAAMCRPAATYLPLALLPAIVARYYGQWRHLCISILLLCCVSVGTVVPWLARNEAVFGLPRLAAIEGLNLYLYNTAFLDAKEHGTRWPIERRQLAYDLQTVIDAQQLNPIEAGEVARHRAIERISNDPVNYALVHIEGSARMFVGHSFEGVFRLVTGRGYDSGSPLSVLSESGSIGTAWRAFVDALSPISLVLIFILGFRVLLLAAALVGLIYLLKRALPMAILCAGVLGYFVAITGPLGIDPRFRAPLVPLLALLGAIGIGHFLESPSLNSRGKAK